MPSPGPGAYNAIRRRALNKTFGRVRRRADGSAKPHQGWDFEASVGMPAEPRSGLPDRLSPWVVFGSCPHNLGVSG